MKLKKLSNPDSGVVLVGTRVSPEQREAFRMVAARNNRSVAGHLRHLIEEQIAADRDRAAA